MNPIHRASTTLALLVPLLCLESRAAEPQDSDAMAEMMAKAQRFTRPGEHHELLQRFIGKWDTVLTLAGQESPGTAEFSWLMDGRWLQSRGSGTMLGMPIETYYLLGYDNFKMSYVTTSVSSMDTAMIHAEGDLDPGGKALLMYGTLDEYLTGEHDKMVKSVWRFLSDDEMLLEVHYLPIGESNTKVFEIRYKRKSR
jgi:hypothetical protein